ncbi:glycerate kinase [Puniceibacterium sp. IMCC21224]|uniref:glycerate kinase type-2 family protein n=1 Tax=Puniceibacterium sp. IMCC21224 TaxID=1618204 RepID=UPI00064DB572|nr:DUF4147 domain-containing protein [Puniceibacterium sp. IMCC21224]KMK67756.1 putative glycerate kinase [Puniceibacterium sp. IMCC21224]
MTTSDTSRTLARTLFDAAVGAANPELALRRQIAQAAMPHGTGRTVLIAVGKAAPAMLAEAMTHVRGPLEALAVTHHENTRDVPDARVMRAGHPVPDQAGFAAGRAVIDLLDSCTADDQVIALISGGGSALLPAPVAGLTLQDKAAVNQVLLSGGLDIVKMNMVRQQLSELKGGGFLRHAEPAPVTAYILSDVIGDDLRAIASGPTVSPIGTASDAVALLKEHGLWDALPVAARAHLDRNVTPPATPQADNVLIGSNRQSLAAMQAAADSAGWQARIVSDALVGDVGDAAREVLAALKPVDTPTVLLFGGETTVRITGTGRGGRNQEMALRVAMEAPAAPSNWTFLSGGTDGRDGPTDAAGGIVDAGTKVRMAAAGADADALLANNDSFAALEAAGDLLLTEATGTNVADVQALLIWP